MRAIGRENFIPFDWNAVEAGHRRHLPQLALTGGIYFVTFRLEDSVPQKLLKRWLYKKHVWLGEHPEPWDETTRKEYQSLFTARMERWLDAGYGECLLRDERCRKELAERLLFKHGSDVRSR